MTAAVLLLFCLGWVQDESAHDRIISDTIWFLRSTNKGEASAVASQMLRWFPERTDLKDYVGQSSAVGKKGKKFLQKVSHRLAALAEEKLREGKGVTAGMEAFRALNLDPDCKDAAGILEYEEGRHPREKELKNEELQRSRWGWIPSGLMASWKPGLVPEGRKMIDEKTADRQHSSWAMRRSLRYTFVTLETDLPMREAAFVGTRVDWFLEWIRARFFLVEGYKEPNWPIVLKIPTEQRDFDDEIEGEVEDEWELLGLSLYPKKEFVIVNGERSRRTHERVWGICQHETAHAFFRLAFAPDHYRHQKFYPWMDEGFPTLCAYVTPDSPSGGGFWKLFMRGLSSIEGGKETLRQMQKGEDYLSELNRLPNLNEKSRRLKAMMMGACFSAFAFSDEELRESYAFFLSEYNAFKVDKKSFTQLFGATDDLSLRMSDWLESQTK